MLFLTRHVFLVRVRAVVELFLVLPSVSRVLFCCVGRYTDYWVNVKYTRVPEEEKWIDTH